MSEASGLPVITDVDLNGVDFPTVVCHNCKPSCSKESPVLYKGEKVTQAARHAILTPKEDADGPG